MVDPEIIRRCTGWPYDRVQNIDERYVSRPDRTLADWCKDLVISGGNENNELPKLTARQASIAIRICVAANHTLSKPFLVESIHRLQLWLQMVHAVAKKGKYKEELEELYSSGDPLWEVEETLLHKRYEILFWKLVDTQKEALVKYLKGCDVNAIPAATVSRNMVKKLCANDIILSRFTSKGSKVYKEPDTMLSETVPVPTDRLVEEDGGRVDAHIEQLSKDGVRELLSGFGIRMSERTTSEDADRSKLKSIYMQPYMIYFGKRKHEENIPLYIISEKRYMGKSQNPLSRMALNYAWKIDKIRRFDALKFNVLCKETPSSKPSFQSMNAGLFPFHRNYSGTFLYADIFMVQNSFKGKHFKRLDPWMVVMDMYSRHMWATRVLYLMQPYTTYALAKLLNKTRDCSEWRYKTKKNVLSCDDTFDKDYIFGNLDDKHVIIDKSFAEIEINVYGAKGLPVRYAYEEAFCKMINEYNKPKVPDAREINVNTSDKPTRDKRNVLERICHDYVDGSLNETLADEFETVARILADKLKTNKNGSEVLQEMKVNSAKKVKLAELKAAISAKHDWYMRKFTELSINPPKGDTADAWETDLRNKLLMKIDDDESVRIKRGSKISKSEYIRDRVDAIVNRTKAYALKSTYVHNDETLDYKLKDLEYDCANCVISLDGPSDYEKVLLELRLKAMEQRNDIGSMFEIADEERFESLLKNYKGFRASPITIEAVPHSVWARRNVSKTVSVNGKTDLARNVREVPSLVTYVVTDSSTTDFGAKASDLIEFMGYKHIIINKKKENQNLMSPIETHFKQIRLMLQLSHQELSIFDRTKNSLPDSIVQNKDTFTHSDEAIERVFQIRNMSVNSGTGRKPRDLWMQDNYYFSKKGAQSVFPVMKTIHPFGTIVDISESSGQIGNHTALQKMSRLVVVGSSATALELAAPSHMNTSELPEGMFDIVGQRDSYMGCASYRLCSIAYAPYRITAVRLDRQFTRSDVRKFIIEITDKTLKIIDKMCTHAKRSHSCEICRNFAERKINAKFFLDVQDVQGLITEYHDQYIEVETLITKESFNIENPVVDPHVQTQVIERLNYKKYDKKKKEDKDKKREPVVL